MDEDVDPLMGPMADLMAEHQLSSTTVKEIPKPVKRMEKKTNLFDHLPVFNIRSVFRNIFNDLLDLYWYYYLKQYSPDIEQDVLLHQSTLWSSLQRLALLCIVYIILTLPFPMLVHFLPGIYICSLLFIDLFLPLLIYSNWFRCLHELRQWMSTIRTHQQWLIKIHGFQLIRSTSSVFESQLSQLRRTIFEELHKHFLITRQIAREYSPANDQLICDIDLHEFGPLIQSSPSDLETLTNHFDQISINSMLKLCYLQINECIQLIHLHRPKSYWNFHTYQTTLTQSMENINRMKRNCSTMVDYIEVEHPSTRKLIPAYFLLRSNCEQLFEMNENDCINPDQLKRIIQDLKTVLFSLEAIQSKPMSTTNPNTTDQVLSNETSPSNISSYHRFDDQLAESMDEILVCDTGHLIDEITDHSSETFDYDQRFLREQTHCLMKELQTAIEGKKQEWNEREERLLGHVEKEILVEKINEEPFERISSMEKPKSMLDELKHSFVLNRKKLHLDEDIFGEEEEENFEDDDSE